MTKNEAIEEEKVLYQKVDKTMYEINVKQAETATESVEDILVRLIANDAAFYEEGDYDG